MSEIDWSGDGRPPVGTVCETMLYGVDGQITWQECRVIHHHPRHPAAAAVAHGGEELLGWSSEFRPIRTPEQIAAKERKAAIEEMVYGAAGCERDGCNTKAFLICSFLYDAGYRRVTP